MARLLGIPRSGGKGRQWILKKGTTPILAVAHADCTQKAAYVSDVIQHPMGNLVFYPKVDDRLGLFTFLHILPTLGIHPSILVTDHEEEGASTGREFAELIGAKHSWNWMVMFDRSGDDVVTYGYTSEETERLVASVGLENRHGAYSCISVMKDMGILGFNWGTGYENNHSLFGYFDLDVYIDMVLRFVEFWTMYGGTKLEYLAPVPRPLKAWLPGKMIYPAEEYPSYPFDDLLDPDVSRYCPYCAQLYFATILHCQQCNAMTLPLEPIPLNLGKDTH